MALPRPTARRTPLPQAKPTLAPSQRVRLQKQSLRLAKRPAFAARLKPRGVVHGMSATRLAMVGLGGCAGAVGVFIAWLQASVPLAVVGTLLAAGAGFMAWRRPRAQALQAGLEIPLDLDAAERLDTLIDRCADELPQPAIDELRELASGLGRMGASLRAGPPGPPWRMEDTMFLGQLLRRYVPDSIEHFLQVPVAQRAVAVMDDGTPAEALAAQLHQLVEELAQCERRLAEACAERLALQGAFLKSRRRG